MVKLVDFILNNSILFYFGVILFICLINFIIYIKKKYLGDFFFFSCIFILFFTIATPTIILKNCWVLEETRISKCRVICSYTEKYAYEKSMFFYKDIVMKYYSSYSADTFNIIVEIDKLDFLGHDEKIKLMEYILSNDIYNVKGTYPSSKLDDLINDVKKNSTEYQKQKKIEEDKKNSIENAKIKERQDLIESITNNR